MKKAGKIICYTISSLIIILSLIFIFIEARNLFSGDWLIYENKADGFIRYLFRLIVAMFSFIVGIFTYVALNKKENKIKRIYFYFGSLTLFVSAIIISIYSTNYFDLIFICLASFHLLGSLLYMIGTHRQNKVGE